MRFLARALLLGLLLALVLATKPAAPAEPPRAPPLPTTATVLLGGRVAEELIYGHDRVTTGAGSDLQKAAELAREMVVNQGMGKKLRNQVFHVDEGMMLERLVHERTYSDETAKVIDDEVEALITEATERARVVVKANLPKLEALKEVLLKKETIEAEEVKKILEGSKMPKAAALY